MKAPRTTTIRPGQRKAYRKANRTEIGIRIAFVAELIRQGERKMVTVFTFSVQWVC